MKTDKDFISYLHKQLVELMYQRKISSDLMAIFRQIIADWEEEKKNG